MFDLAGEAPVQGPTVHICDGNGGTWSSPIFAGSDDLLLVVASGDLDPQPLDSFELQFDQPLRNLEGVAAETVAVPGRQRLGEVFQVRRFRSACHPNRPTPLQPDRHLLELPRLWHMPTVPR